MSEPIDDATCKRIIYALATIAMDHDADHYGLPVVKLPEMYQAIRGAILSPDEPTPEVVPVPTAPTVPDSAMLDAIICALDPLGLTIRSPDHRNRARDAIRNAINHLEGRPLPDPLVERAEAFVRLLSDGIDCDTSLVHINRDYDRRLAIGLADLIRSALPPSAE